MAKSKKKKYILPLIIVVIIILAVMKSCGVFGSNEKIDQVDTQQATTATIVQIVTASGKIKPSTEVKIAPEVSGEITQLTVKEGDEVKKGQTLITFDMDAIKAAGYDVTTPLIVTNTDDYEEVKMLAEGTVNNSSEVLEVK